LVEPESKMLTLVTKLRSQS